MSLSLRLIISTICLAAHVANAASLSGTQSAQREKLIRPKTTKNILADVSLQVAQHTYSETGITIEGPMFGAAGSLYGRLGESFFLGGRGEFMTGSTTYSGFYLDSKRTPVSSASSDKFFDIAALAKLEVYSAGKSSSQLFSGLAYRAHHNKVSDSGGYARDIDAIYLPFGGNTQFTIGHDWSIGGEGELDLLVSGQTRSQLSDVDSRSSDVQHIQKNGFGFKVSIKGIYSFNGMSLQFGPYYSYWNVQESDGVATNLSGRATTTIEPQNLTTRLGFGAGVLF